MDTQHQAPVPSAAPKADHGSSSEVTWDHGTGRQPDANQPPGADSPGAADEVEDGNRGEHSGQALEHLEQARGTP